MLESAIPINHKENDQSQRRVHGKEYPPAKTVSLQFGFRILAGLILAQITHKIKSHDSKTNIISTKGIIPKGAMIEAEP